MNIPCHESACHVSNHLIKLMKICPSRAWLGHDSGVQRSAGASRVVVGMISQTVVASSLTPSALWWPPYGNWRIGLRRGFGGPPRSVFFEMEHSDSINHTGTARELARYTNTSSGTPSVHSCLASVRLVHVLVYYSPWEHT